MGGYPEETVLCGRISGGDLCLVGGYRRRLYLVGGYREETVLCGKISGGDRA